MEVVLGMDFGGTKIALAVCGLDGRCLAQQVLATNPDAGGDAVLERGISAGRALLALSGEHHDLVSVGVSTIGIPREDRVELAPAIPGWEHVGLARAVAAAFGVPVRVVTDVKAAATAEARWGSLAGADPAIYLNLGYGPGRRHPGGREGPGRGPRRIGGDRLQPGRPRGRRPRHRCPPDARAHRERDGPRRPRFPGAGAHGHRRAGLRGRPLRPRAGRYGRHLDRRAQLSSGQPRHRRRPRPGRRRWRDGEILGAHPRAARTRAQLAACPFPPNSSWQTTRSMPRSSARWRWGPRPPAPVGPAGPVFPQEKAEARRPL